jgi:pyruvate formate lyase activating enzyme
VLFDLKHVDNEKHAAITGMPVNPILANLNALNELTVPVWLRVPLIPGINDDISALRQMAHLAKANPCIQQVDILGYHRTGIAKYARLGMVYGLDTVTPPTVEQLRTVVNLFRSEGVRAHSPGVF